MRMRIAETKTQVDMMAHGVWLRGWYLLRNMKGPAAFPIAYAHSMIAFVVTPAQMVNVLFMKLK
jgi:hypothetical protein